MNEYSFSSSLAMEAGPLNAIVLAGMLKARSLSTFRTEMVSSVRPKGTHFKLRGFLWTECPSKALRRIIPFMSSRTLSNHMLWLRQHGYIFCAELNPMAMDKTTWFTINPHKCKKE